MKNEIKKKQICFASHAIGLDQKKPYKRHGRYFYKGYAEAGKENKYGGRTYYLTRKGLDWLGEELGIVIYDEED